VLGCATTRRHHTEHQPPFKNLVVNPLTNELLAERDEWIYRQDPQTHAWQRLIPGTCPQWFPDGRKFYYFLDVGYDGCRAELWSADHHGEARLRMSTSDYFIRRSPVVSQDAKSLAWHYSTCHASGPFQDILLLHLRSLDEPAEPKVIARYPELAKIGPIEWTEDGLLSVTVNGEVVELNPKAQGNKPIQ